MAQHPGIQQLRPADTSFPETVSPGVRAGDWVFVAGQLATDHRTGLAPSIAGSNAFTNDRVAQESRVLLESMREIAAEGGADLATDTVRIYQWFTDPKMTLEHLDGDFFPSVKVNSYVPVLGAFLTPPGPASTAIGVRQQLVADSRIQADSILLATDTPRTGFAVPDGVPKPIIKYSPALRRGDYVYLAGELPTDWRGDYFRAEHRGSSNALADEASVNRHFWYDSEIEAQTDYTLWKLSKTAEAAGASFSRAVRAEVYLTHPDDFVGMDRVWRKWFPDNPPARNTVPYIGLAARDARIEISLQLLTNDSPLRVETVHTDEAPAGLGHEPQAVRCGDLIYFSTLYPHDGHGVLESGLSRVPGLPYSGNPVAAQMSRVQENIDRIAYAGGSSAANVVRMLAVFDDLKHYQPAIDAWTLPSDAVPPAITAVGLMGGPMVVPGAHFSLDVTAYAPQH